jgi:hypothetical protein
MLAYLDTLIGFAVIMLGANLLWGLETMFKNLPGCPLVNDAKTAAKVTRSVLIRRLISDSIFSLNRSGWGNASGWPRRLIRTNSSLS